MSDTIRNLARQAAAAKDEGKFTRVIELYNEACEQAPDRIEHVRNTFADAGVSVSGQIPQGREVGMVFTTKG